MRILAQRVALLSGVLLACAAGDPARAAPPVELDPSVRAVVLSAPRPDYPYEARRNVWTGSGIVIMEIDRVSGRVTNAYMQQSTGHQVLDAEALSVFKRWRFKPGTVAMVRVPITFAKVGDGQGGVSYERQTDSMRDMLARFLGKGRVIDAPMPTYPVSPPWTNKTGRGVYELHVSKGGKVDDVKVLTSSGDPASDEITKRGFRKWRFRPGKAVIVELPLTFTLTPTAYHVKIR